MDADALELLGAARQLADRVWRSEAPAEVRASVASRLRALSEELAPFYEGAPVATKLGGRLPGRGHPLLPPVLRRMVDGRLSGVVTFTSAHAGAGAAVHGGQVTLLFDEVLGGVAADVVAMNRTAYLKVDYRALTPLAVELRVEGWVARVEGRKIYVAGHLLDGDRVCADAEALYLAVEQW